MNKMTRILFYFGIFLSIAGFFLETNAQETFDFNEWGKTGIPTLNSPGSFTGIGGVYYNFGLMPGTQYSIRISGNFSGTAPQIYNSAGTTTNLLADAFGTIKVFTAKNPYIYINLSTPSTVTITGITTARTTLVKDGVTFNTTWFHDCQPTGGTLTNVTTNSYMTNGGCGMRSILTTPGKAYALKVSGSISTDPFNSGFSIGTGSNLVSYSAVMQLNTSNGFADSVVFGTSSISLATHTNFVGANHTITINTFKLYDISVGAVTYNPTTLKILPSAPILLSPINGASDVTIPVQLAWSSTGTYYTIEVSYDLAFTDTEIDITGYSGTYLPILEKTPSREGAEPATTYYWRVRALNSEGLGDWSSIGYFTTAAAVAPTPDKVTLIAPHNGFKTSSSPQLTWSPALNATEYTLSLTKEGGTENIISGINGGITYYDLTDLEEDAKYFWKVRGENEDGNGEYSDIWNFTIDSDDPVVALPATPVLLFPSDGAINLPKNIQPQWAAAANAISYDIQVSTTNDFSNNLVNTNIAGLFYNLQDLNNGETYYWRVRGKNIDGVSDWTTRSFTIASINPSLPDAPILINPADNATAVEVNVTFSWQSVVGLNWQLQVATDNDFNGLIQNIESISTNSEQVNGLAYNTEYFWRVRAKNLDGYGDWSEIRSFTTKSGSTPILSKNGIVITEDFTGDTYDSDNWILSGFTIASESIASNAVNNVFNTKVISSANSSFDVRGNFWASGGGNLGGHLGFFSEQGADPNSGAYIEIKYLNYYSLEIKRNDTILYSYVLNNPSEPLYYDPHLTQVTYDRETGEVKFYVDGIQVGTTQIVDFGNTQFYAGVYVNDSGSQWAIADDLYVDYCPDEYLMPPSITITSPKQGDLFYQPQIDIRWSYINPSEFSSTCSIIQDTQTVVYVYDNDELIYKAFNDTTFPYTVSTPGSHIIKTVLGHYEDNGDIFLQNPVSQDNPEIIGTGTKADPYLLYSEEHLNEMKYLSGFYPGFAGVENPPGTDNGYKYFKLMNDIDLGGSLDTDHNGWRGFWFTGELDGNNHRIRNAELSYYLEDNRREILFTPNSVTDLTISGRCVIKNLIISAITSSHEFIYNVDIERMLLDTISIIDDETYGTPTEYALYSNAVTKDCALLDVKAQNIVIDIDISFNSALGNVFYVGGLSSRTVSVERCYFQGSISAKANNIGTVYGDTVTGTVSAFGFIGLESFTSPLIMKDVIVDVELSGSTYLIYAGIGIGDFQSIQNVSVNARYADSLQYIYPIATGFSYYNGKPSPTNYLKYTEDNIFLETYKGLIDTLFYGTPVDSTVIFNQAGTLLNYMTGSSIVVVNNKFTFAEWEEMIVTDLASNAVGIYIMDERDLRIISVTPVISSSPIIADSLKIVVGMAGKTGEIKFSYLAGQWMDWEIAPGNLTTEYGEIEYTFPIFSNEYNMTKIKVESFPDTTGWVRKLTVLDQALMVKDKRICADVNPGMILTGWATDLSCGWSACSGLYKGSTTVSHFVTADTFYYKESVTQHFLPTCEDGHRIEVDREPTEPVGRPDGRFPFTKDGWTYTLEYYPVAQFLQTKEARIIGTYENVSYTLIDKLPTYSLSGTSWMDETQIFVKYNYPPSNPTAKKYFEVMLSRPWTTLIAFNLLKPLDLTVYSDEEDINLGEFTPKENMRTYFRGIHPKILKF